MYIRKFTDGQLRECLDRGMRQSAIARELNVVDSTIAARIRKLNRKLKSVEDIDGGVATLWNTRNAAEENYKRALKLLEGECNSPGDKVRAICEVRQHLQLAADIVKTLYSTQETQAFMDEVMAVIDASEPGTRQTILRRLRDLRAVRQDAGRGH